MKRTIEFELKRWVGDPDRKVLLVRGARQVGKTYSIRELGRQFEHYLELNFEAVPQLGRFFSDSADVKVISEKLSMFAGKPIIPGKTLLFLDEIQGCLDAIRSLRFFHEQMPGLHVVAAGSLLEFALSEIPSFGVGRISSLYMHPFSFLEFLDADGRRGLGDAVRAASVERPLDAPFHKILLDRLRAFLLIGGMPEAIRVFLENGDFSRVGRVHDDLINGYKDDFAKYKKLVPATRLQEVLASAAAQTGGKFKYVSIGNERAAAYKQALDLLVLAGLAHTVYHTSARGVPLGAQINPKKFKVMMFDTGIFQRLSGLDVSSYVSMTDEELVNKGVLAELHVALELVKQHSPYTRAELYYWHRESRSSNAEVDFVLQTPRGIVPVEVKSGVRGAMQSMRIFLEERKMDRGIRVSSESFGRVGKIDLVPLYAAGTLLSWAEPTPSLSVTPLSSLSDGL